MAIEWVARSQKPIVEIGGCPVKGCNLRALAYDLNLCIAHSGEPVRGFVIPDGIAGYCCYGFYRYPWAIEALLSTSQGKPLPANQPTFLWLRGLVFGYSPDAIQRFISSASRVLKSSSHSRPYKRVRLLGKVEMYGPLASSVRHRNNPNGRYRQWHC